MKKSEHDILRTGGFARHATWLELFYDLIYVVVIARLAHLITHAHDHHLSLEAYLLFVALFISVWWAWTGHTMFQNRFDNDDTRHRIETLLQMLATCFLAVFITKAFGTHANGFALSYFVIRTLLLAMYLRVHQQGGKHKPVTSLFLTGFSIGAAFWLASLFVPAPYKFGLWGAGLAIEIITPWIGRKRLTQASVHTSHLPERLGLLTIIVLGESVVSIVGGIETTSLNAASLTTILFGFILLGAIWWFYFDALENALMGAKYTNGQLAIYGHLPIYLGLVTLAAGVRYGINGDISALETGWLLSGGILLFLVPLQIIYASYSSSSSMLKFISLNAAFDLALLAMASFATWSDPKYPLIATTVLFTAYVFYQAPKCKAG